MHLEKIISGGQTGVDQAALVVAVANNFPYGGWIPKNRETEHGPLDKRFQMEETPLHDHTQRTEWNVRDSSGTAIFSLIPDLEGGTLKTLQYVLLYQRPLLHLIVESKALDEDNIQALRLFIEANHIRSLNVAGPRESDAPGIFERVKSILTRALFPEPETW